MDSKEYFEAHNVEKYGFLWSEARLVIAALALFLGGIPPVLALLPIAALFGIVRFFLALSWIISGAVSAYLLYRWVTGGKVLFGKKDSTDMAAFLVGAVSGINLGLAGLTGTNLGMSISTNRVIFTFVGLVYLASAWHLYQRWNSFGKKIF